MVEENRSTEAPVPSGVPQNSVLGRAASLLTLHQRFAQTYS